MSTCNFRRRYEFFAARSHSLRCLRCISIIQFVYCLQLFYFNATKFTTLKFSTHSKKLLKVLKIAATCTSKLLVVVVFPIVEGILEGMSSACLNVSLSSHLLTKKTYKCWRELGHDWKNTWKPMVLV